MRRGDQEGGKEGKDDVEAISMWRGWDIRTWFARELSEGQRFGITWGV